MSVRYFQQWCSSRFGLFKWFLCGSIKNQVIMFPKNQYSLCRKLYIFAKACHEARAFLMPDRTCSLEWLPNKTERQEFLNQFDDDSKQVIIHSPWFEYAEHLEEDMAYVFIDENPKPLSEDSSAQLQKCRRNYWLPGKETYAEEVFLAHHGLKNAPPEILDYLKEKLFIDAGAYIGDTALVLLNYNPKKVLSFDISAKNKTSYEHTMKMNRIHPDQYEFICAALGPHQAKMTFADTGFAVTSLKADGSNECDIIPLESCAKIQEEKVGFIKTDVEGAGVETLKGAIQIIRRDRPVLSLAVYHSPEEFYQTRKYLEANVENYIYKMVMLSRMNHSETILFGWPKELHVSKEWWWSTP